MDWSHGLSYVRYITGLAGNQALFAKVAKQHKRAEKEFQEDGKPIRRFLYAAAFVMANKIKRTLFKDTEAERFTMDSFIKHIMLSAVYIREKKTCVRISVSPNHRHRAELEQALTKTAA